MADHKNKRSNIQKQNDRTFISKLMARNNNVRAIARLLNESNLSEGIDYTLSFQQVHYDMKLILKEWKEMRHGSIDELIDREILKIDHLEEEAWHAWEASKTGRQKIVRDGGVIVDGTVTGGSIDKIEFNDSNGDTKYLDKVEWCIERRIELLGLKTVKIEHSGKIVHEEKKADLSKVSTSALREFKNSISSNGVSSN